MEALNATCSNAVSVGAAQLLFTQLIATLTKFYCDLYPKYPKDSSSKIFSENEEYDFIVIGAGSAGSAIANRLSEIHNWKVLLIEAGSDPPIESNIPEMWSTMLGTKYDWNFKTEKSEKACRGMINRQCIWNKGKMLGGSSSINVMFYVRGNSKDYDEWENLGNEGWGYEEVLKYFKKLENVNISYADSSAHGYDGYINVEEFGETPLFNLQLFEQMIKNATLKLGYPYIDDLAAHMRSGVTNSWGTVSNGMRSSTATAYLSTITERTNLFIMKETRVTRLLIDKNRVYAVEVNKNGASKIIRSKKEIVLAAGAINSPQLLMLSGIGPKDHLQQFGLPVVADLKVGYNLQDHIFLHCMFLKFNFKSQQFLDTDRFYNYLAKKTELAQGTLRTLIFMDSTNSVNEYPDLQFHFILLRPNDPSTQGYYESLSIQPELRKQIYKVNKDSYLLEFLPKLLRPKSRGRIMLASANPFDSPKIVHNYLTRKEDTETMVKGIKFAKKLIATGSFTNATLFFVNVPECENLKMDSDEYYECYVRNFASTVYHASGSCKMGPRSDPDAVVDPRLKVYGLSGLRVADTSIMPNVVSGNTNIPAIMIGEKAADLIKEDWMKHDSHSEL